MQIQISWLLQKPTDLDLHSLLRRGMSCSAREGLKMFVLILSMSCKKPFVFSASVLCSQIFTTKLNLRSKIGLAYAISTVNLIFGKILFENIFCFSSDMILIYWSSITILWNFRHFEKVGPVESLHLNYLTYCLHNLQPFLLWERIFGNKKKKKNLYRKYKTEHSIYGIHTEGIQKKDNRLM